MFEHNSCLIEVYEKVRNDAKVSQKYACFSADL